jgi:MFS family permease
VGGRLGDVFGRRRLFLIGLALFAAASAACGLATSATALIAYRALQGLAGAMLQPQVLGLLSVNFDSKERPRVFGLYAAALGCAGIAAQLIGGTLVEFLPLDLGWRACFLIVVPGLPRSWSSCRTSYPCPAAEPVLPRSIR